MFILNCADAVMGLTNIVVDHLRTKRSHRWFELRAVGLYIHILEDFSKSP